MKNRGFTLVELVLVIAMLGVMGASIGPWMINAMRGYDLISTRRLMLGQVRAGLDRMVREIRLIPGPAQITNAGASSFQFQYPTGTSITYALNGTDLRRNSDNLVNNITSVSFIYYTETGSTTTTAANVRSVQIQINADPPGSTPGYTVRARVFLRNTGNNHANFTTP